MSDSKRLAEIKKRYEDSTPGNWGPYTANRPFYAIVTKPAPSLSKHDEERPTYWKVEDAVFLLGAREDVPFLLDLVDSLQNRVGDLEMDAKTHD